MGLEFSFYPVMISYICFKCFWFCYGPYFKHFCCMLSLSGVSFVLFLSEFLEDSVPSFYCSFDSRGAICYYLFFFFMYCSTFFITPMIDTTISKTNCITLIKPPITTVSNETIPKIISISDFISGLIEYFSDTF